MWEGNKASQPSDLLQRGKCQVMFDQESCFVTVSGHFENHTETTRNLKQALHHSDQKFYLIQVRKSAKPRTDESFQQAVSQTWQGFKSRQDLTCPVFQAQNSDSRLTGLQLLWHCSPTSLTPTTPLATLCRNPSLQLHEQAGEGPTDRLLSVPNRQENNDLPSAATSPMVVFVSLKKEGISTAHPLVFPDELLEEALNKPTLTFSYVPEIRSELQGSFSVIVIWQLLCLPVNGNGQTRLPWHSKTHSTAPALGLILQCWACKLEATFREWFWGQVKQKQTQSISATLS